MARLQILELPTTPGDDQPSFILVIDEYEPPPYPAEPDTSPFEGLAEKIGARAVLAFEETIDIPANDTTAYLAAAEEHAAQPAIGQQLADGRTEITRDMYRLAKWKQELTNALGMDRLRDWDDIHNAAAGIRKQRDAQAAEVERLRAGEESATEQGVIPTPGQWIRKWNQATAEKRLNMAAQILEAMTRSSNCFMADHEAQITSLRAELERSRAKSPDA
ncbi:hypothetical protein PYK79_10860 [Streptomyces sp. ID05-04B]|uniref:hypothetical protein n=1 Tax=Streptomyces sp. ID05-04B TaxID=3028661 RepID=UPI0029C1FF67|nr:hypothetical protein [Streptomyces sp. ID05-04B]MDX5563753.1 hypothetical protein [Streptomyces sp. ID05-04B]